MNKSVYYRGKIGTVWYNFTECLAYVALHRPTPKGCDYRKLRYGDEKKQYVNLCTRKDLAAVRKPVFIYVHGGGWISGITEMRFGAQDLTAQYRALGIPCAAFEGTGLLGNHAWTIATIVKQGKSCLEDAVRFVESVTARTAKRQKQGG